MLNKSFDSLSPLAVKAASFALSSVLVLLLALPILGVAGRIVA